MVPNTTKTSQKIVEPKEMKAPIEEIMFQPCMASG